MYPAIGRREELVLRVDVCAVGEGLEERRAESGVKRRVVIETDCDAGFHTSVRAQFETIAFLVFRLNHRLLSERNAIHSFLPLLRDREQLNKRLRLYRSLRLTVLFDFGPGGGPDVDGLAIGLELEEAAIFEKEESHLDQTSGLIVAELLILGIKTQRSLF